MNQTNYDPNLRVAPKETHGYWTAENWQTANNENNWPTMYQVFIDRLNYRYWVAVQALIDADKRQPSRRFGFSIMALDCLLIETLAQFYLGLRTSNDARCKKGHKLSNMDFYVGFLLRDSLRLNEIFDTEQKARLFYRTIRCGILHQGETTGSSKIVTNTSSILEDASKDGVTINRSLFHEFLAEQEYKAYCEKLESNEPPVYRANMIKKMGHICHIPVEDGDHV